MSEINFNVADQHPYDCLYHGKTYGYRACLNGKKIGIAKIETVCSLIDKFGLPDLAVAPEDVKSFEACLFGEDK